MKAILKVFIEPRGWYTGRPAPSEETIEVGSGDVLGDKLAARMRDGKVVVHSIDAQKIVIQVWDLAPQQPDGTMDIFGLAPGGEVALQVGEHARLGTLTPDSGTSYTITLGSLKS